jgi:hypothetical protein
MAARALFASVLLSAAIAHAQSTRLPAAPLAPTSHAECEAADARWRQVTLDITKRHSSCLESAACKGRNRNPAYRGPCSCEACHSLHDAMLGYPKIRASQAQSCRQQVDAHLRQQKAWEEQLARMRDANVPRQTVPRTQPPTLDLSVRPPVMADPRSGERILRERIEERIRQQEHRQAVIEGTVRALTASRDDAAEQGAEAMGQALGLGVTRLLGWKHTIDYEAEAEAILRERTFQEELMKEMEAGWRRDLDEIQRATILPPLAVPPSQQGQPP